MRLNLGCGDRYAEGWTNVDLVEMPHRKDAAVDLTGSLPWEPNSVESVYAGHVLEHLELWDAVRLLARLEVVVKPGHPIMLVGPDVDVGYELLGEHGSDEYGATLNTLRHGAGRWLGDVHRWECTADKLTYMLKLTDWGRVTRMDLEEVATVWPVADPRPRWQVAVGALKV